MSDQKDDSRSVGERIAGRLREERMLCCSTESASKIIDSALHIIKVQSLPTGQEKEKPWRAVAFTMASKELTFFWPDGTEQRCVLSNQAADDILNAHNATLAPPTVQAESTQEEETDALTGGTQTPQTAGTASSKPQPGEGWVLVENRLPEVPPRSRQRFIIAFRSKHSGKIYTDVAPFANHYWLEWSDDYGNPNEEDESEGKHWDGWMEDRLTGGNDEISCQHEHAADVIAWRPLPEFRAEAPDETRSLESVQPGEKK